MQQIQDFLAYCEEDLSQRGKDDALISNDSSFMFDNMKEIAQETRAKLLPDKMFYEGFITEKKAQIENLKRFGFVDTVEELTSQQNIAETELKQCRDFESHLDVTLKIYDQNSGDIRKLDWGIAQIRMSSYARGFQKGVIDTIK